MSWTTRAWTVAFCLWAIPTHAAVLDPWAFTSLGTLNASETISINTDTLQLTGGTSYTGVLDPVSGASIFAFDDITGTSLSIYGTRTLGLLSTGNIAFTGTIDLLGSGGLDIGAVGALAMKNLSALGSGGDIVLHANQITISGSINWVHRSLTITSPEDIVFLGGAGLLPAPGGPLPVLGPGGVITVAPVPLPAALPLYATGLGVLSLFLKRRRLV
ncbi:MAG: hypothetical protein Q8L77_04010 [Nitrospirota bacterium]|nr:hypothetical protein [Nitrospirota bacterium]